jgi:hemoglobin-like flavoprotein
MTAPTNPIQQSFELATARSEDMTPLVYRRLFSEHPEAEKMFQRDADDLVKGSMPAMSIGHGISGNLRGREWLRPRRLS